MTTELQPGQEFAGHRIERVAGRGGMGVVYEATDLRLKRRVALKVIAPALAAEPNFQQRFERECELAASIDHPGVIPVFAAGEENGAPYVTMRYVEGTDLAQMIARDGRLPPDLVATVARQVGDALDSAHARGLVHRDVKPANVLVRGGPGGEEVFLTDFGLTREVSSDTRFTATGHVIGTVDYMSPEQFEDSTVDALSDVYALACVLYEALTGEVPFPAEGSAAKLFAHTTADRPSVLDRAPDLPPVLDRVVQKGMATSRPDRFQSTGELGRAAAAAIEGDVAQATAALGVVGAGGPVAGPSETTESVREEETTESPPAGESATVPLPPEAPPSRPLPPPPPARAPAPPPPPVRARRRGPTPLAIALGIVSLLAVAAIAYAVLGGSDDSGSGAGGETASDSSAPDSSAPESGGGDSGEELDAADLALAAEVPAGAAADVMDYDRGLIEQKGYDRRVMLVQLRDPNISEEAARAQALDELILNRWMRAEAEDVGYEPSDTEFQNEVSTAAWAEEVARLDEVGYDSGGIVLDTEARLAAERLYGEDSAPVDALMSGYDPALADEISSLIDKWRPGTACTEELAPLSPLCGNGPDP